jgi:hypothetical protein
VFEGAGSTFGDPSGLTIPHVQGGGEPRARIVRPATAARGPLFVTRMASSAMRIATEPSLSVRYTRAPCSRSRANVPGAGWPYRLPAPAEATATDGRAASRKASVEAVALP